MESFNDFLHQYSTESIIFIVFIILLFIQLFYYCFFYKKPLSYQKKNKENLNLETPGVSVIIVAKDNSEKLRKNLPVILEQKYPNFEVIVVNIGFTEETEILIKSLKLNYPNLYDTFVPHEPLEKNSNRKKLALTIGIKAAKNDILLFTEADTMPSTDSWIHSMVESMTKDKDVVVGYCSYKKSNKFFNRVARFDNLLYSLQYLSSAIRKKPYIGTYQNLAYRKKLFFDNKGFSTSLNFEYSEGIFINSIMNSNNVAVALNRDSFVTTDMEEFVKWERLRIYTYKIKKHFRNFRFSMNHFYVEVLSRYLFYISFILLLYRSIIIENWTLTGIVSLLFLIKIITQLVIINKSAKYFQAGSFKLSFILMEIIQPIYNLSFKALSRKKRSKL